MSAHCLCFEQKYEIYQSFLSEKFQFLKVKFSIYLNRRVWVMFYHVLSQLAFRFRSISANYILKHFGSGEEAQNRFSRWRPKWHAGYPI